MKNFIMLFLLLLNSSFLSYGQKFLISEIPSEQYTIDRINQEVYLKDYFSDTVRKVNIQKMDISKTDFLINLPSFANKHRLYFYYKDGKGYVYNIDNGTDLLIKDSVGNPAQLSYETSFSPNDSNYLFYKKYFSLSDSLLNYLETTADISYNVVDAPPRWSSDTSFVFISNDSTILEYYLYSRRIDTLVIVHNYKRITGFDYNLDQDILAYGVDELPPKIYFHYKDSIGDSLVFSPFRDDSLDACWNSFIIFSSIKWSPDFSKLAFFSMNTTAFSSGIYLFSIDSTKVFKAKECNDPHFKYGLNWVTNDILIYSDPYEGLVYGLDVKFIFTGIDEKRGGEMNDDLFIVNYPNPFNPSTTINYSIRETGMVKIKVFNILGREIKELVNERKQAGNYSVEFNSLGLSSGVYVYTLEINGSFKSNKMLLLK